MYLRVRPFLCAQVILIDRIGNSTHLLGKSNGTTGGYGGPAESV